MSFLLTLIGAMLGAAIGASLDFRGYEGAFVGGLVGAVAGLLIGLVREVRHYARVRELEKQVAALGRQLRRVEARLGAAADRVASRAAPDLGGPETTPAADTNPDHANATPPETPATPATPDTAPPARPQARDATSALEIDLPETVLEAAARRARAPLDTDSMESAWQAADGKANPPPADSERASAQGEALAFLLRGNTIAKVGVAILFTGIAFLAKYAADSGLLPIELRFAAIGFVAMALTALGWRLREQRRDYALVLQGGGIAVLYLTVFAALRLYQLLPASLAGVLLVAIAVAAAVLAVGQDARVLALVGAAGGFAAPVLASTGTGDHVVLFSYYLVLNLGIFVVAWFKAWRELNLAGFLFTYGIGAAWGARNYQPSDLGSVEPFLVIFFLLYVAVAVLFALRQPPRLRGYVDGSLVFGVPLATFALQHRLMEPYELGAAYSVLGMAALYIGLATFVLRRLDRPLRLLGEAFLAIGVGFATLAVPLGLDARATAATWALEGAAAVWIGVRQQRVLARIAGVALQLAAGVSLAIAYGDAEGLRAGFNGRVLGMALIAIATLISLWHLERARDSLRSFELPALPWLAGYGLIAWYGIGVLEATPVFGHDERAGGLLLFFTVSAAAMAWLSRRISLAALGVPATSLVPAGALLALATLLDGSYPLAGPGLIAWPLLFVVVYRVLHGRAPEHENALERWQHAGALWLLAAVLAWQAGHQAHVLVGAAGAWRLAAAALAPAALVALVLRFVDRAAWLPGARPRLYLGHGLAPVAALLAVWVLYACVAHDGDPWPLVYIPLLNPLDVSIGLVLLVLVAWLRRLEAEITLDGDDVALPRVAWRVLALLGFTWLNAVLARAAHFWGGVPYELDDLLASAGYQASLAVLWGGLGIAAMVAGARRARRPLWVTGAALMGLVVVKLLVFDLANTGTVARIVSFIASGALLLAVGYLAPAPPREDNGEETPSDESAATRSAQP